MTTTDAKTGGLNALDWVVIAAAGVCAVVLILYALRLRESKGTDGKPPLD